MTPKPQKEDPATIPLDSNPPPGPCYLLIKKKDDSSFAKANPFALARDLDATLGPLLEAKPIRSGALLIKTHHRTQTERALQLTALNQKEVTAEIAVQLNCKQGIVKSDQLTDMSNADLLEELRAQGVVRVQRLPSRDVQRRGPNPSVRLSFAKTELPTHIRCGYSRVEVNPWVPPPSLCQRCWYNHDTRNCRRRVAICGRCAQDHPTDQCPGNEPFCYHCEGPHPAWDKRCPLRQEAAQEHQARLQQARNEHHARATGGETWPLDGEQFPMMHRDRGRGRGPQPHPQGHHWDPTGLDREGATGGRTGRDPQAQRDQGARPRVPTIQQPDPHHEAPNEHHAQSTIHQPHHEALKEQHARAPQGSQEGVPPQRGPTQNPETPNKEPQREREAHLDQPQPTSTPKTPGRGHRNKPRPAEFGDTSQVGATLPSEAKSRRARSAHARLRATSAVKPVKPLANNHMDGDDSEASTIEASGSGSEDEGNQTVRDPPSPSPRKLRGRTISRTSSRSSSRAPSPTPKH